VDRRDFIRNSGVALSYLASVEGAASAATEQFEQDAAAHRPGRIVLTEKEYFEGPGFVFLIYHNNYSGMQGGLQMIQNGERLLDSGSLLLTAKGSAVRVVNRILRRTVDRERSTATIFGEVTDLKLGYQLVCRADGDRMIVTLRFDRPLDWSRIQEAGFQIFLYPPAYFENSFQGDSMTGTFPRRFNGDLVLLNSRRVLRIAQEDSMHSVAFERSEGVLRLEDERGHHPTAWFSVIAPIEPGSTATELEVEIKPTINPQWRRAPVIGVSQVGYHPKQMKRAVVELDHRDEFVEKISLVKMTTGGDRKLVKAESLKPWGRFLYYKYGTFEFTEVADPGVYVLEYRGQTAGPFRIDPKVYDQAWRPTLEVFLPVQMCHVAVREGNRTWHGPCHLDDASQAPAGRMHFDGYQQGEPETRFADFQHIPGLNWGGWHDAGDHDLPAGSIASTTLALALAQEEFEPGLDQTTVRRSERVVLLHIPDGEEDLLQQIEYGVEGLLASFRAAGHIFPGIIESTHEQYDHTGDPVNITDNRVFDSSLKPDEVTGERSGKRDDRWAFTNRNTGLQYHVVQALAAANRVLRGKNSVLAEECLAAARKIWDYEQANAPVYAPSAYVPSHGSSFPGDEVAATAELWLTTGDAAYQQRVYALLDHVRTAPPEQFGRGPGWTLVRLMPRASDPEFRKLVLDKATKWKAAMDALESSNPYGIRFPSWVLRPGWKLDSPAQLRGGAMMGFGWDLQTDAMHHYFFHKHLPEIFDANSLLAVVNFVLGCHPATNTSYVSGVGANSQLLAYGFNRDDYTYIPGGVISGASFIRPEFMELKNFPYHFNQTEYVIHGAASYIFDVLAAQWILEHQHPVEAA
jgi:endoglucanase